MKFRLVVAILALLLVAACAPVRRGVSWPDVTVLGGHILVAYNDYLALVDPANGRLVNLLNTEGEVRTDDEGRPRLWQVSGGDTDSQFFTSPIWVDDENFLMADYNNKLITINRERADVEVGSEIPLDGHVIADPLLVDDKILLPFKDNDLVAYDAENYDELWRLETERGIWGAPIVVDDVVYVGVMDHTLYALNLDNGDVIWSTDVGGAIASAPLYHEGHLYLGTFNRALLDVSAETGEILNEYKVSDWVWSTPVLVDNTLYVTDLGGKVYAFDTNFELIWETRVSSRGIRPSPLVTDEYVIVGDRGGRVSWLVRSTGAIVEDFTQELDAEILSDLVLLERADQEPLVIVSTVSNGKVLVAFTLDGVQSWTYER